MTDPQKSKQLYQCPECGLRYDEKTWADKCEVWCKEHHSCNLEITSHAVKNNLTTSISGSNGSKLDKVKKVYSFWGKFSFLYSAQDMFTFLGRAKTIRGGAVEKLGLKQGDRVLEVACGSGKNFPYLVRAVGTEGVILGFDYSQEMLEAAGELCRRNNWGNIRLIQGDAARLNIIETSFDGVLSVLGISAIPGWEEALKRCRDVLHLGGKLVVCDARLFTGFFKFLNPLIRFIYSKFAAWDHSKNIPEKMKEIFGNVEVENFNFKTFFISVSTKE